MVSIVIPLLTLMLVVGLVWLVAQRPSRPHETEPSTRVVAEHRIPAVAEALGYLGGMLAVIGLGLILSRFWSDLATSSRLALSAGGALLLLGAGALARETADPALARLRWFLWLGATAAAGAVAAIATIDGLDAAPETVAAATAATVATLSALLWGGRPRPLQELTCFGGVVVAAGALTAEVATGGAVGLVVWAVGAALVIIGLGRLAPLPLVPEIVGAATVVVGSAMVATAWEGPGLLFVVATGLVLAALATVGDIAVERAERAVLLAVSAVTLLQSVPPALGWFSRDAAAATGTATWVAGGLLVLVGYRGTIRLARQTQLLGSLAMLGGAALTWEQWHGGATIFGIATAVGLIVLGVVPGQLLSSVVGSIGLLVNVPWAVGWFFPGEGRAPLLLMVVGGLVIAVAVLLARVAGHGGRPSSMLGT